ncbi:MAG: hypothetical protein AAB587_02755 [Patescibacteria group bacterium]
MALIIGGPLGIVAFVMVVLILTGKIKGEWWGGVLASSSWRLSIIFAVAYGVIACISPSTFEGYVRNWGLFLILTVGGLLIAKFFKLQKTSAVVFLLLGVFLIQQGSLDWSKEQELKKKETKAAAEIKKITIKFGLSKFDAPLKGWSKPVSCPLGSSYVFGSHGAMSVKMIHRDGETVIEIPPTSEAYEFALDDRIPDEFDDWAYKAPWAFGKVVKEDILFQFQSRSGEPVRVAISVRMV